jgi:flagellar biosynthesis protein
MLRKGAIAIGYDGERDEAPRVLAKGFGKIAEEIVEIGKENDVMIREDELLFESLARLDVSENVPPKLYQVIAELLAYVYKVEQKFNGIV